MESTYAFVNARAIQEQRLKLLSALLDEGTFRVLEQRGVQPGWRCLEIGAGGGSVAAWMCERVGPTGSVLATDLDTTVVGRLRHPNLEVRVHDVLSDELTEDEFDLAHARLVLAWLTDPSAALRRIAAALKPGGSLVIEEMDFLSLVPDPRVDPRDRELFEAAIRAHNAVLGSQHAFDPHFGRGAVGALIECGLVNIGSEGRTAIWSGGHPGGEVWRLTLMQLREPMIGTGLMSADDLDAVTELCGDPRLRFMSQITMAAWGQRRS